MSFRVNSCHFESFHNHIIFESFHINVESFHINFESFHIILHQFHSLQFAWEIPNILEIILYHFFLVVKDLNSLSLVFVEKKSNDHLKYSVAVMSAVVDTAFFYTSIKFARIMTVFRFFFLFSFSCNIQNHLGL